MQQDRKLFATNDINIHLLLDYADFIFKVLNILISIDIFFDRRKHLSGRMIAVTYI